MTPKVIFERKDSNTSAIEAQFLTTADREHIATLKSEKRVREQSLWRALLRKGLYDMGVNEQIYNAQIAYNSVGAPYLRVSCTEPIHFSISHSRTAVAVLIDSKICAIDIEELSRNFSPAASRFATDIEMEIVATATDDNLALIWSVKESIYKLCGVDGLDFITDMKITKIDSEKKSVEIQISNLYTYVLHYSFTALTGHIIVASSDF